MVDGAGLVGGGGALDGVAEQGPVSQSEGDAGTARTDAPAIAPAAGPELGDTGLAKSEATEPCAGLVNTWAADLFCGGDGEEASSLGAMEDGGDGSADSDASEDGAQAETDSDPGGDAGSEGESDAESEGESEAGAGEPTEGEGAPAPAEDGATGTSPSLDAAGQEGAAPGDGTIPAPPPSRGPGSAVSSARFLPIGQQTGKRLSDGKFSGKAPLAGGTRERPAAGPEVVERQAGGELTPLKPEALRPHVLGWNHRVPGSGSPHPEHGLKAARSPWLASLIRTRQLRAHERPGAEHTGWRRAHLPHPGCLIHPEAGGWRDRAWRGGGVSSSRCMPRSGGRRLSDNKAQARSVDQWMSDFRRMRTRMTTQWNRKVIKAEGQRLAG